MITCDICGKEFSPKGIGSHKWRVHGKGKEHKTHGGGWNKGLSKHSDDRVRKYAETLSTKIASGEIQMWQTGLTKETCVSLQKSSKTISKTVNKKVIDGTWHFSFSKTRTHIYKGLHLRGKWEVAYAQYLDAHNVDWIQPTKSFPYTFEGKTRQYFPDFYLLEEDLYVEIKGYETPKDRAKWKEFPHKLLILKGKDLVKLGLDIEYKKVSL